MPVVRPAAALVAVVAFLSVIGIPAAQAAQHLLPLFTADGGLPRGFARIINHSDRAGTVRIHGTDDSGQAYGPVTLDLEPMAARHFNSGDLEDGNVSKGLSGSLGDGDGSWRLRLETDLDIEPAAYVGTSDGFLASVHDVVRTVEVGGETVYWVPIFNPAGDGDPHHELAAAHQPHRCKRGSDDRRPRRRRRTTA